MTPERPNQSVEPLFYSLPANETESEKTCIVPLNEYYHTQKEQYLYSTKPTTQEKGWTRTENPLCRVFKAPTGPLLLDSKAKPTASHIVILSTVKNLNASER